MYNNKTINNYGLNFIINGTSTDYDLQSVYNANSHIRIIIDLSQVCLAVYDTDIILFSYTGSENIDITDNQISLNFPIKINDEVVLSPRAYDNAVFEMISGSGNFVFRQNTIHGGQPIAQLYPSTKACTFHGDCHSKYV